MSIVKQALKSAIDAMIMYQLKLDSTFIDEAIVDCKAALAELEKCEPVPVRCDKTVDMFEVQQSIRTTDEIRELLKAAGYD